MSFDEAYWVSRADSVLNEDRFRIFQQSSVTQHIHTLFVMAPSTYWNDLLASIEKWEDDDEVTPEFVNKFNKVWDARKLIRKDSTMLRNESTETLKALLKLAVEVIGDMREFKRQEKDEKQKEEEEKGKK